MGDKIMHKMKTELKPHSSAKLVSVVTPPFISREFVSSKGLLEHSRTCAPRSNFSRC